MRTSIAQQWDDADEALASLWSCSYPGYVAPDLTLLTLLNEPGDPTFVDFSARAVSRAICPC
jgi:hypothetical protein